MARPPVIDVVPEQLVRSTACALGPMSSALAGGRRSDQLGGLLVSDAHGGQWPVLNHGCLAT